MHNACSYAYGSTTRGPCQQRAPGVTEKPDNGLLRNSPGWRIRRRFPGVHCPRRAPSVHSEERRVCKQVADKRKKRGLRGFIFLPYFRPYAIAAVIFLKKFATGPQRHSTPLKLFSAHCFRALEYNARGGACYLETTPATILRCPLRPASARQPVDERRGKECGLTATLQIHTIGKRIIG